MGVDNALCASAQVEQLKFKLLNGTPARNAVNNILGGIMRRNAIGCMCVVGGKIRGQRAKAQKYSSGYLISTGQPKKEFVDTAVRHVNMRQGVLGLKLSIMGTLEKKVDGELVVMPDYIKIRDAKNDNIKDIVPAVEFHNRGDAAT